jgi:hypothetical protein
MRFMLINKSTPDDEAGIMPSQEVIDGVGQIMEDMQKAGVLLVGEGVKPSSQGARVTVTNGKRTVTDGPFTETKELVGGIVIVDVRNRDEAIEWAARLAEVLDTQMEVRPLVEASDLP